MRVDLDKQLRFPVEITTTSLRPDIVAWSTKAKSMLLIEFTIAAEEGIEATYKRKKAKYSEWQLNAGWLAGRLPSIQWKSDAGAVNNMPTEGRRSDWTEGNLKKATKELAEEAEKGRFWLWLRRKDKYWGKSN
ncbi:hypothetical protein GBF38_019530 [Nibea albiflora]|uniref:Uncharacterized protein n=1 Tax=Nibea albiflora TaxID=240163 RepID=A0ACB7F2P1_NIBAL|nr:hypothetical protein GBF38_019530 [Nibea albiflora]